ncbi:MAG: carbon-nitrogen hydrolase family protein [Pseudoramibacter sp.]
MGRWLNVGIVQMPCGEDAADNIAYFETQLRRLMAGHHRPELVVGVECLDALAPQPIPGRLTRYFGRLAKHYGIYLIPGTIYETAPELPEGRFYNTAPVFNPKGELIGRYRKMAPWQPEEDSAEPGREYLVFDIPEKDTKVGVQICYDLNFPEISRNETLMGAEVLVKLTMDPEELYRINTHLHYARALENQAYLVSTNAVGFFQSSHQYGHSQVISPEGQLVWEGDSSPAVATVTLDLDLVRRCRQYGTLFLDHYLRHLMAYRFPMPYAEDVRQSPLGRTLEAAPENPKAYLDNLQAIGAEPISRGAAPSAPPEIWAEKLEAFLEAREREK